MRPLNVAMYKAYIEDRQITSYIASPAFTTNIRERPLLW